MPTPPPPRGVESRPHGSLINYLIFKILFFTKYIHEMPRRYKKKRNYKRRKKAYASKHSNVMVSSRNPIANTGYVRMRYVQDVDLDPVIGTATSVGFSALGLYDPYVPVGGHQPLGFDQWMTFYDHYTVLGAKCSVTFSSNSTNPVGGGDAVVGIDLSDAGTGALSTTNIREQGNCAYAVLSASKGSLSLSKTFSLKKFFGLRTKAIPDKYTGNVAANPQETCVFRVFVGGKTATQDPGPITCSVTVSYYVRLIEPKILPSS